MSVADQTETKPETPPANLPVIAGPRLPYHPLVEERFGIDRSSWRALVESTFPNAKTVDSVILALSYCRARNLDPFRRVVHIVPIWDKERHCWVETVWPGITEFRTTAFRTGQYAGKKPTEFGPMMTKSWPSGDKAVEVTYPEWAQVTVFRLVGDKKVEWPGPRAYWLETFASTKNGAPNSMWQKRPSGQIEKCAEAGSLRCAFPEELGSDYTSDEAFLSHGRPAIDVDSEPPKQIESLDELTTKLKAEGESETTEPPTETPHDSTADHVCTGDPPSLTPQGESGGIIQGLGGFADVLLAAKGVIEVDAALKEWLPRFDESHHDMVKEAAKARKAEIRNARGQGSNKPGATEESEPDGEPRE